MISENRILISENDFLDIKFIFDIIRKWQLLYFLILELEFPISFKENYVILSRNLFSDNRKYF